MRWVPMYTLSHLLARGIVLVDVTAGAVHIKYVCICEFKQCFSV